MNKLREVKRELKEGQILEFSNKSTEFFTKGKKYIIRSSNYNSGKDQTFVNLRDDKGNSHGVTEKFISKNFI